MMHYTSYQTTALPLLPCATALILEARPTYQSLYTRVLADEYAITFVEDTTQVFHTLYKEKVDILLLDVLLNNEDGRDLLRKIRKNPAWKNIAVVFVSAIADADVIAEALQAGANDYIIQPIQPVTFKARINAQRELKRTLDQNAAAIRQLEESQHIQTRLMKMARHDLRHPLTNIRMAEHMLFDYIKKNPDSAQIFSSVVASLDNMQAVFDDFLSAFELGEQSLDVTYVPVQIALDMVCLQYEPTAAYKQITLQQGDLSNVVYADAARLEQAISNLVSNAIKYSPLNSLVTLESSCDEQGMVRISVSDEGPGIPPEERHLLFTEFGKLSTQPTGNEPSVGLGLWIVKYLIESMGGTVGAHFPPDGGSVFWVALPTQPPAQIR